MKKLLFRLAGICATLSAPLLFASVAHAVVDTCTWTGGGSDANFSTASNWSGCDNGTVPEAGDTLSFPANITNRSAQNDMVAGTSFQAIIFSGVASSNSDYTLSGNGISLVGGVSNTMTQATNTESVSVTFNLPLTLSANQTFASGASYVQIDNIDISTFSLSISNGYINGTISGSGTLTVTGFLTLSGDNIGFTGPIVVNSGTLTSRSATALGDPISGTSIAQAAFLRFCSVTADTTIAEPLTLNGTPGDSTIYATPGSCASNFSLPTTNTKLTLTGDVILMSDVTFSPYGTDLIISGTYTSNGHAFLVEPGGAGTLTLPTGVVGSEPIVRTYADSSPGSTLNIGHNTTAIVTGTYGDVFMTDGGVLKGTGTVGAVSILDGKLAPGMSPGCINTGNLNFASSSATYEVELSGLTACTQYDQTKVTGTVIVGGTLQIVRYNNMVPRLNNSFTIIENDGTDVVTGTFAGLAQGATVTSDGITYTVSYTGGDGNDVVLTVTGVSASLGAPNTGFAQLLKSGATLPVLAMLSGFAVIGIQTATRKRR